MEQLRELGLNGYEAKIYQCLLEYGHLQAKEIAQKSAVPITAVYPNLKGLLGKNLVQKFSGEVASFEALQPSLTLPTYIAQQKKLLDDLQQSLTENLEKIYHKKQIFPEKEVVTISMGREASSAIYQNTLKRAKKSFFVLGWHFVKVKDKYVFLQQFRQALGKGVELRVILTGPPEKDWKLVKAYQDAGIKMRYTPLDNFSLLIVDKQECKITLKSKDYPQKFNIFVKDQALAQALQAYFITVWQKAQAV